MELSESDTLIKHLVAMARKQDGTTQRLEEAMRAIRAFGQQQMVVNTPHTTLILRIARTLDLIEEQLGQRLQPPHG